MNNYSEHNYADQRAAKVERPGTISLCEKLNVSLASLEKEAEALSEHLTPVLSPTNNAPSKLAEVAPATSEVNSRLTTAGERIDLLVRKLGELRERAKL